MIDAVESGQVAEQIPTEHPGVCTRWALARVSTLDQDPGLQIRDLLKAGIDETQIFVEKVSGVAKKRPVRDACLKMLREGDTLTIWKLDRLGRSLDELLRTIEKLRDRGIILEILKEGIKLDPEENSVITMLFIQILGAFAEFERNIIIERCRAGVLTRAEKGKWRGGPRLFGFQIQGKGRNSTLAPYPEEGTHVFEMFKQLLKTGNLGDVERYLRENNLKTVNGEMWTRPRIRNYMMNPYLAGLVEIRARSSEWYGSGPGDILIATINAEWDGIVPVDTWRAAVALLKNPSRKTNHRGPKQVWLGAGTYLCGKCNDGTTMMSGGSSWVNRAGVKFTGSTYRCSKSNTTSHLSRKSVAVDEYVESELLRRLSSKRMREFYTDMMTASEDASLGDLHIRLQGYREELTGAEEDYASGRLKRNLFHKVQDRLQPLISELEAELDKLAEDRIVGSLITATDIEEQWCSLSVERRSLILRSLATVKIKAVGRGYKGTVEDSVEINWLNPEQALTA